MDTVIFLGAGASASEGAPLQNGIFEKYFLSKKSAVQPEVKSFFEKVFLTEVTKNKNNFPTFEDVLGVLDLAIIKNQSLRGYSLNKLREIRGYIHATLVSVLNETLSVGIQHRKLVANLYAHGHLKNCCFVSTNYDILIDNALGEMYQNNISMDYFIEFANWTYRGKGGKWHWDRPGYDKIDLIKIHGSLNWLFCPSCNKIWITPYEKGASTYFSMSVKERCLQCKSVLLPVLIPPTYYKELSNVFIANLLYLMEQKVREAEHLIFCGFSLPDSDMHIKYALKRGQLNRNKSLKITVLNDYPGKTQESRDEESRRYSRFFGNLIDYKTMCFEDFAEMPDKVI